MPSTSKTAHRSSLHADGIKAPELDIVAICDVIREGLVHDVAEWKDTSIPASTKMPLVGWSFCAPVESESNGRGSKSAMHAFSKQEIQVRKICVEGGGPKACAKAGRCGAHGVPSLRSLALGYVAPFVADIAQETASSLPSNVRATLIALARCVHGCCTCSACKHSHLQEQHDVSMYRQRHELTDAALISLVDESFASLDLHGCGHIRPTSLVGAIARLPLLRSLDISGCSFTSELVYSLPYSCPLLRVLRLSGCSTTLIDLRAWQRLIPRVLPSTADTWEEEAPSRSRCATSCLVSRNRLACCRFLRCLILHLAMQLAATGSCQLLTCMTHIACYRI